ncbi:hypothetical protein OC845_006282 [Tilletia horrida]|nr:hypothetical protein OC845_006282 [Tilletia horrida]
MRSADRVQAWLALFDIIAAVAVIVYWVIFVTVATAEQHGHLPPSPFVDSRTSFLLATSTCLRPASLTLVSGLSFLHLRRGKMINLGSFDWTLWTTAFAATFALSLMCWTISMTLTQNLSRNTLPGTLIGFNFILNSISTLCLIGLMQAIYRASLVMSLPVRRIRRPSQSKAGAEKTLPAAPPLILPSQPEIYAAAGKIRHNEAQDDLMPPERHGDGNNVETRHSRPLPSAEIMPGPPPVTGTMTTSTGGAQSAIATSGVASSADPYRINATGTRTTTGGSRSAQESVSDRRAKLSRARSGQQLCIAEETSQCQGHDLHDFSVPVEGPAHACEVRTPAVIRCASSASTSIDSPDHWDQSRKSIKAALEGISKAGQGPDVEEWRYSLSMPALGDANTTSIEMKQDQHSSPPHQHETSQPDTEVSLSHRRMYAEVEEEVDRMFTEVGLGSFVKSRWRQTFPLAAFELACSGADQSIGENDPHRHFFTPGELGDTHPRPAFTVARSMPSMRLDAVTSHREAPVASRYPPSAARTSGNGHRDTGTSLSSSFLSPTPTPGASTPSLGLHRTDSSNSLCSLLVIPAGEHARYPMINMPTEPAAQTTCDARGDLLGAESALLRIASYATLRAVDAGLADAESRGPALEAGNAPEDATIPSVQSIHSQELRDAEARERRVSERETKIAYVRLGSHMVCLWLTFILSLPYLTFYWTHPHGSSAHCAQAVLLVLATLLSGPLSLLQIFLVYEQREGAFARAVGRFLQQLHQAELACAPTLERARRRCGHVGTSFVSTLISMRTLVEDKMAHRRGANTTTPAPPVRSVPYERRHWTAGQVTGDRVVRPRSAFVRGMSLLFEPNPRLEVLPSERDSSSIRSQVQRLWEIRPRVSFDHMHEQRSPRPSDATSSETFGSARRQHIPETSSFHPPGRAVNASSRVSPPPLPPPRGLPPRNDFRLDGLSAMLLPRLVPGLSIGPEMEVADDDERTLVEEYRQFYHRYLSDLPDLFSVASAREAFEGIRNSIMRRIQAQGRAGASSSSSLSPPQPSCDVITLNSIGEVDAASRLSFETALPDMSLEELDDKPPPVPPKDNDPPPPAEHTLEGQGLRTDVSNSNARGHKNHGRSSSVSVEFSEAVASARSVSIRSRRGRHRETFSLPDARPQSLDVSARQSTLGSIEDETSVQDEPSSEKVGSLAQNASMSLEVDALANTNRRSLASELGLNSMRPSLGSEMGLESVGSGPNRRSLSADFGILLASLRRQSEQSPTSSERTTSNSLISTLISDLSSVSTASIHPTSLSSSLGPVTTSDPPPSKTAAPHKGEVGGQSMSEQSLSALHQELSSPLLQANAPLEEEQQHQQEQEQGMTTAEFSQIVESMDPLTLHRYLHPAIPLETLDEVTEEMTADLTRSLEEIWTRSQRDSFMRPQRGGGGVGHLTTTATPARAKGKKLWLEYGPDTPCSVMGNYGSVLIKRRDGEDDEQDGVEAVHPRGDACLSTVDLNAVESGVSLLPFDTSVWISEPAAKLALKGSDDIVPEVQNPAGLAAADTTIAFEREAEWVSHPNRMTTTPITKVRGEGSARFSSSLMVRKMQGRDGQSHEGEAIKMSGRIPSIHVRAPSDSSAMSFFHV